MKRLAICIILAVLILLISACSYKEALQPKYILKELPETDLESIGNTIPEWVENIHWDKALYAVTSSDLEVFDKYMSDIFPTLSDPKWTQEQSDSVYLGKGIKLFVLDDSKEINSIVYYPVILNGVIVSGCKAVLCGDEMSVQLSPVLANRLDLIMDLTSQDTPLILGYNNSNTIAIIGDTYFVLEEDHMLRAQADLDLIPDIEINSIVNAMDVFSSERTANVSDWVMSDR